MTTIGYATIQIIPSLRGVSDSIRRQMGGMPQIGRNMGRQLGSNIAEGVRASEADVKRALDNHAKLADKAADAVGKVRTAEAQLQQLRSSGVNEARIIAASERLEKSRRDEVRAATAASDAHKEYERTARLAGTASTAVVSSSNRFRDALRAIGDHANKSSGNLRGLASAASSVGTVVRTAAVGTIGFSALLGVITGVSSLLAGPLVAALASATAAMGVAAGAASGILGPALLGLAAGFKGMQDGAKAYDATQKAGASQTKAVATAVKQVEQAEKAVEHAKRDSRNAERDLTKARKEATEQVEDMNLALRDGALSERDAQLSLLEAQRDLANLGKDGQSFDSLDQERAILRIQQAEQRLAETRESNGDLAEKADEVNRVGIEGSDQVVRAKERVVEANEAVADAEQRVADAQQAAADAQSAGASGVDPFDAMIGQRMAPALDAVKNFRHTVTDSLTGALEPGFKTFGGLLDGLAPKIGGLAGVFGKIGTSVASNLASPANVAAFDKMIAASSTFFSKFLGGSGISAVVNGMIKFATTAADTFKNFGGGLDAQLKRFGDWLGSISPAKMLATFAALRSVITSISNVVKPIFSGLKEMAGVAAPALAPGFKAIGDAIKEAWPGVMAMARELMPALGQAMHNIAPILPALVDAFKGWVTVIASTAPGLASIASHLGPMAPVLLGVALAVKAVQGAMFLWTAALAGVSVAQGIHAAATGAGTVALVGNRVALISYRVAMIAGAAVTGAVTAAQWLLNAALSANPIGLIVIAIAAFVAGIIYAYNHSETFRKIVQACWAGIKAAVEAVVNWFTDTAWPFLKKVWEGIGEGWSWLVTKAGEVWTGIKDRFTSMVDWFKNLPTAISNAARGLWDGLKQGLVAVLNWIADKWNSFAEALSFHVPGTDIDIKIPKMPKFEAKEGFAIGGFTGALPINQIAGVVHGGEHVIKATSRNMIESAHPGLLDHMNSTGRLPGYDTGGQVAQAGEEKSAPSDLAVRAKQFAISIDPAKYLMGGFSPGAIDCSGLVSAVANVATGRPPFQSRMSTVTEGTWLQNLGFKPGTGGPGDLRVGWWDKGGGANGHTAGTFPDGTNFESNGSEGVVVGGKTGAGSGQFTQHAFLASALLGSGDGSKPSSGLSSKGDTGPIPQSLIQPLKSGAGLPSSESVNSGSGTSSFQVPTSISEAAGMGFQGLNVKSQVTPNSPVRSFEYGNVIGSAVSGQVGSLLGAFGVGDSPSWLNAAGQLFGSISIGGGSGASSAVPSVGSSASGFAPFAQNPDDDKAKANLYDGGGWLPQGTSLAENRSGAPEAVLTQDYWRIAQDGINVATTMAKGFVGGGGTGGKQAPPPVVYNISSRDTEDGFIRAQRQERERAATKLSRF